MFAYEVAHIVGPVSARHIAIAVQVWAGWRKLSAINRPYQAKLS